MKTCNQLTAPSVHALQGYVAYSAVLYILVVVTWLSLAACGYVGWRFHKNGVVPNKWCVCVWWGWRYSAMLLQPVTQQRTAQ
jgi:hypothetical protein